MKAVQIIIGTLLLLALILVFIRNGVVAGLIVTVSMLPASIMFLKGEIE